MATNSLSSITSGYLAQNRPVFPLAVQFPQPKGFVASSPSERNGNGSSHAPTLTDCVRRMVLAHVTSDQATFLKAAEEYAFEERRRNHHAVAKDLEKILESIRRQPRSLAPVPPPSGANPDLPRDRERGLQLIDLREPQRSLGDLCLTADATATLDLVLSENRQGDVLRSRGLRPSNKLLFCGPPGCGKTVTAEALAKDLYLPLAVVRFEAVISSYLGETSANLARVFDFARSRPMVMLFDEFDAIGKRRTDETEHGELKRVVNALLQLIDRFRGETVLIAATNHEGTLDPAIWRRFDEIISFPKPNRTQIGSLLTRHLRQFGIAPNLAVPKLANRLVGMSHSDVERIALDAIKQALLAGEDRISTNRLIAAADRQLARLQTSQVGDDRPVRPTARKRGG